MSDILPLEPVTSSGDRIEVSLGSRIVRGAAAGFALNTLGSGFLFLGQLLIARLLTKSEYAQFTVSISFVAIMALIADLGMTSLLTRLFAGAEEEVSSNGEDRRGVLLGSALTLRLGLSVLVAVLVFLTAPILYPVSWEPDLAILLIALLISSRLLIVRSVGDAVLRGRGKYYLSALFGFFDAAAFAILMILATYRHFNLDLVIWVYVLCNVPGFAMLVWSIVRWMKSERIRLRVDFGIAYSILKSSVPLALGTAFLTIHIQIDNILLYKLSTPLEVSNFGASIRLSAAMAPFSIVLAAVTAPELTRLLHRGDSARARQLTDITLRLLLVSAAAIALVVTSLAKVIVPLLLGDKYDSAISLFIWTGWMLVPIFTATFLVEATVAAGKFWIPTIWAAFIMISVIFGDLLLIGSFGAEGAMASKFIAVSLGSALLVVLSRNSSYLDIRRYMFDLLRFSGAVAVGCLFLWIISDSELNVWFKASAVLITYLATVHITGLLRLSEGHALLKKLWLFFPR